MSKILFDSFTIDKSIKPNIDGAKDNLVNAFSQINEEQVPIDFIYRNAYIKMKESIKKIEQRIDHYDSWIKNTEKEYINESNECYTNLKNINNLNINKRINKIVK